MVREKEKNRRRERKREFKTHREGEREKEREREREREKEKERSLFLASGGNGTEECRKLPFRGGPWWLGAATSSGGVGAGWVGGLAAWTGAKSSRATAHMMLVRGSAPLPTPTPTPTPAPTPSQRHLIGLVRRVASSTLLGLGFTVKLCAKKKRAH